MNLDQTKIRADRIFWIEKAIREMHIHKKLLDYETFWVHIADIYECSEKKAKEYIKIAKKRVKGYMTLEWA